MLPAGEHLHATNARTIIHLGKNGDPWWDNAQLLQQIKTAIRIFEYLHPLGTIGIFIFDCSSAHEAFADDALNVRNMNVKPGGKQRKLRNTIIPFNNPPPKPSQKHTQPLRAKLGSVPLNFLIIFL